MRIEWFEQNGAVHLQTVARATDLGIATEARWKESPPLLHPLRGPQPRWP